MVKARIVIDKTRCTQCHLCTRFCPTNVFRVENKSIIAKDEFCIACYGCVKLCPANAISIEILSYTLIEYVKYC